MLLIILHAEQNNQSLINVILVIFIFFMAITNPERLDKQTPVDSAKGLNLEPGTDFNLAANRKQNQTKSHQLATKLFSISKQAVTIIISLIIVTGLLVFFIVYFKLLYTRSKQQTYDLIKLNSTSALCLDGSPVAYHLSQNGDPSKILVYVGGGGWCFDQTQQKMIESCYQRSFTEYGSSNYLAQTLYLKQGILSREQNNYFKDWKKVYLQYCDGTGHQGYRKDPISYKGTKLYFRGYNNTVQRFQDLENRLGIFTRAQKVLVQGGSAGGLAVVMWANYLADRMKKGKIWIVPDAGHFHNAMHITAKKYLYKEKLATMMKISNAQVDLPVPQCLARFPDAKQNCMLAQNLYQHVKAPLFIVQSYYDLYAVPNILGVSCILNSLKTCTSDQLQVIDSYRKNITQVLQRVAQNKTNGVWAISCPKHNILIQPQYVSFDFLVSQYTGYSALRAVTEWMENPDQNNTHIDMIPWPENKPCA